MKKFKQYFNSTTIRGRANVTKATYASFAALYLYNHFKRRQNKSTETVFSDADADIENYSPESQDIKGVEEHKCPSCELDQENKSVDESQQFHEATPTLDSPNDKQDNTTAIAESIVASSSSKSHCGTKQFEERNHYHSAESPPPDKGSCP